MKNENLSPEERQCIDRINYTAKNAFGCGEEIVIDSSTGITYLRNNMFEAGVGTLYQEFGRLRVETLDIEGLFHEKVRFEKDFGKTDWNVTLADWAAFLTSKILDGTLSVRGLE